MSEDNGAPYTRINDKLAINTAIAGGGVSFTPSIYGTPVTITAGLASVGALASGVSRVKFINDGVGDVKIAFGTDAADAEANLTISGGVATTGEPLDDIAAWGAAGILTLNVPAAATHYAICNGTAAETPTVTVNQGK
jgi:hypothetical protein